MAKQINTRLMLKHDSLTNWNESSLVLKPGEIGVAYVDVATKDSKGNVVHVPTALLKVGENVEGSTKTFKDLPFVSAVAADVYAWAKKEGIEVIDEGTGEVLADITWDASKNALVLSRIDVVTPTELAAALANYYTKSEIDTLIAGYYTKDELDRLIGDLDVGAIEGRVDALETATGKTLPDLINGVDAKFANYTKTADLATTIDGLGYAKVAEIPTNNNQLTNGAGYQTANDVATAISGKADSTKVAEDIAAAIAPLATTEELNKVKETAEAARTETEVNDQIDAKITALDLDNTYDAKGAAADVAEDLTEYVNAHAGDYTNKQIDDAIAAVSGDLTNYYTKTEADAAFMTQDEVDARVNKVITDAVEGDTLTSLTELVQYINTHGGDAAEMATAIENIEKQLEGIGAGTGTVKKYVDDAVTALKIGDYAKAQDLLDLAARVKAIEDAPYATTANVATAKNEAIAAAKTETETQITALNIAQYETINGAAGKYEEKGVAKSLVDGLGIGDYMKTADAEATYEKKNVAQGLIDGLNISQYETITGAAGKYEEKGVAQGIIDGLKLAETYEPIGAEGRAIAAAKTETENQIKALNIGDYAKSADVANTYRAKADKITSDDLSNEVFVFNCGTASTVI